jgi:pSer/pThr/pTyr-binding forkhead associated (FHA) protein
MIALLFTMPDGTEIECVLLGDEIKVGRIEGCDVILNDVSVSTSHALIEKGDDGVYAITDLDSTNGTKVNGTPVMKAKLRVGDAIKIGGIHGRVFESGSEEVDAEVGEEESGEGGKSSARVAIKTRQPKPRGEDVPALEERKETIAPVDFRPIPSAKPQSAVEPPRPSVTTAQTSYQEPMFDTHFWFTLISLMILAGLVGLCLKHFNLTGGFLVKDFFAENPIELKEESGK